MEVLLQCRQSAAHSCAIARWNKLTIPRDKVDSVSGWPLWHLRIIARDCRLENSVSSGAVVAVLAVCSHMAVFAAVLSPCWLAGCIPLCQGLKCYLQLTVTLPGWTPPSGFPLPLSQPFSTQINAATSRLLDRARISEEDKKNTHYAVRRLERGR
jgi:hypothetical protein